MAFSIASNCLESSFAAKTICMSDVEILVVAIDASVSGFEREASLAPSINNRITFPMMCTRVARDPCDAGSLRLREPYRET